MTGIFVLFQWLNNYLAIEVMGVDAIKFIMLRITHSGSFKTGVFM
jgi:hypothetical protein